MKVIDARVRLPHLSRPQQQYVAPDLQRQQYDRILGISDKMNTNSLADLLTQMQTNGVDQAVMHAETEGYEDADGLNEALAAVVAERPSTFRGVGTVGLGRESPTRLARQVQSIDSLGFVGVSVQPAFFGLDIDDRSLYPLYSRAEELELVVGVHTGITYSRMHPLRHERPEMLDQVACDFPDLRLIACHAGWPYVTEFCAVARRHPTVYLEFGGLAPKYVARPRTGWDALFSMLPNVLRDQVLFGSDWPVMPLERVLSEWSDSGLSAETLERLLYLNAATLFGFDQDGEGPAATAGDA